MGVVCDAIRSFANAVSVDVDHLSDTVHQQFNQPRVRITPIETRTCQPGIHILQLHASSFYDKATPGPVYTLIKFAHGIRKGNAKCTCALVLETESVGVVGR